MGDRMEDYVPCDCTKEGNGIPKRTCNKCDGSGWKKKPPVDHDQGGYQGGE